MSRKEEKKLPAYMREQGNPIRQKTLMSGNT